MSEECVCCGSTFKGRLRELVEARQLGSWFAAEAAYWRTLATSDDAWRASLEQELKTARAERDAAIREQYSAKWAATAAQAQFAAANRDYITMRDVQREASRERDRAREERDAAIKALDEANQVLADERNQQSTAPLDPGSPADLRRAADLLDYPQLDGLISSKYSRVAYLLRTEADRIDANAAEDGLVEKVARAITPVHCAWEEWGSEARAAIAVVREAGQ